MHSEQGRTIIDSECDLAKCHKIYIERFKAGVCRVRMIYKYFDRQTMEIAYCKDEYLKRYAEELTDQGKRIKAVLEG